MNFSSRRSNKSPSELQSVIDVLDLAVDRRTAAASGFPLRHGLGEPSRSSPELKVDSPVYKAVIHLSTAELNSSVEMQDAVAPDSPRPPHQVLCTIDALDLAVDSLRISSAVDQPPLLRKPFRSSPELSTQSPLYGESKTVSPELPQTPAPLSDRRKSAWKRSRRFVWKCLGAKHPLAPLQFAPMGFRSEWIDTDAFVSNNIRQPKCLICDENFKNNKKSNIERHFLSKHDSFASFVVSHEIMKSGKPFTDGEYIKKCFIGMSEHLFSEFKNKTEIINKIKDIPLSATTVRDRAVRMTENVSGQQFSDLKSSPVFSLACDESCDVKNIAQFILMGRYVSSTGVHEVQSPPFNFTFKKF
ncbi:hypothetical protein QTP88_013511 [Uroleucon formosanum]